MILFPLVLGAALAATGAPASSVPAQPEASPLAVASIAGLSASVLQDAEEEGPDGLWHGAWNVGLSRSEGNADIETYSLDARGVREFDTERYTLEALWYFARDGQRFDDTGSPDSLIQRRLLGSAKYDRFLSEKAYFWGNVMAETNLAARLDLRWTVGGGFGYQWRDDEQWKFNTEAGLAYFDERFNNGAEVDYLAVRLAWDVWTRVAENLVFGHYGEIFPSLDDVDDFYGRATTYFEAQLASSMTARLSWLAVFDNTPTTGDDGKRLERLDNLYLFTLGWTF